MCHGVAGLLGVRWSDVPRGRVEGPRRRTGVDSALLAPRIVGQPLEQGATPATDEDLDKLMVLRAYTARRIVN
jgi:hypothetical protein